MSNASCVDQEQLEAESGSAPYKSENPSHSRLALKHGGHFLVLDENGQMPRAASAGYGLYYADTRYLNRWELRLNGAPLRPLRSSVSDGFAAQFVFGNTGMPALPEQTVLVERELLIVDERFHERIKIKNFGLSSTCLSLQVLFDSDFADMFEVRGSKRPKRGENLPAEIEANNRFFVASYRGLDGLMMQTRIDFATLLPSTLSNRAATFKLSLDAAEQVVIELAVSTELEGDKDSRLVTVSVPGFDESETAAHQAYANWRASGATITTGNETFNELLERGYRDLYILRQPTPRGGCLAAGIPWFTVAFGRDQAVTGMETLPFLPELSREIIEVLAAYQANIDDEFTAQQVGKIMHELRLGEMARLREIPFVPYYGTVDATQLWLMLLCRYTAWTGDLRLARRLWKKVRLALTHLDSATTTGGYITYGGRNAALTNQGWKDSGDSVMYSDGKLAEGPIALCEAQGYLYAAWSGLANVANALGYTRQARTLNRKAASLKQRFARDFWMPEKNFVALALDGHGRQCDVVSSNPGHLLDTGILSPEMAATVAERLGKPDMFCGWGVRTLSSEERNYNPMSYHNGSVWPHDNAMAAAGLRTAGQNALTHDIMSGLFSAATAEADLRLPELFCGFDRDGHGGPIRYPVSCVPQAWAAGAMFMFVSACLGLQPDALKGELRIVSPSIPAWLGTVKVTGLRIGSSRVDLEFATTSDGGTTCRVLSQANALKVSLAA